MLDSEKREEWENRHREGAVLQRIIDRISEAILGGKIRYRSSLTLNELAEITGSNKQTLKKYIAEIQAFLYPYGIRFKPTGLYVDPEDDEPNVTIIMNCAFKASIEKGVEDVVTEFHEGAIPGPLPGSLIRFDKKGGQVVITPLPGFGKIRISLPVSSAQA
jgi:hypothetical protein